MEKKEKKKKEKDKENKKRKRKSNDIIGKAKKKITKLVKLKGR